MTTGEQHLSTEALAELGELLTQGSIREAMVVLQSLQTAPLTPHDLEEVRRFRHEAYKLARFPAPGPKAVPDPDRWAMQGIPEISGDDLTAEVLRSAICARGCLLVRGLLSSDRATSLRDDIVRAIQAAEQSDRGTAATPWYIPFEASGGYAFGGLERSLVRQFAGVLTVDSPAVLARLIDAFYDINFGEVLADYFGEWPALSVKKSTLRHARPDSGTEWHQDGSFLGPGTASVNAWVSLSHCGTDAPSIDVIPHRYESIVGAGGEGAQFDWSVSDEDARQLAPVQMVRPVFAPGDALLFDQLTLHRTGIDEAMTSDRFAIESWFFAPSTYPHDQVPILF